MAINVYLGLIYTYTQEFHYCSLNFYYFFDRVSLHSPGWLQLKTLQAQSPEGWDLRCAHHAQSYYCIFKFFFFRCSGSN